MNGVSPQGVWRTILMFILLLMSSMLLLSPLGANYLLVYGGNYFPEPVFVLIIVITSAIFPRFFGFVASIAKSPFFAISLLSCLVAALLGMTLNGTNLIDSYSASRSYMVFVIGVCAVIVASRKEISFQKLFISNIRILATCTLISSLIYFAVIHGASSIKSAYSITAIILLGYMSIYEKNVLKQAIVISLLIYCAVLSSYRAYILYVFIMFFSVYLNNILSVILLRKNGIVLNLASLRRLFVLISVLIILGPSIVDGVTEWVMQDSSRYHQIVYKMEQQYYDLINGTVDGSTDARLDMYDFFFANVHGYILPSGFFDRQSYVMSAPWINEAIRFDGSSPSRDGGFFFMAMTFGVMYLSILLFLFVYKFSVSMKKLSFKDSLLKMPMIITGVMLFVSMGNIFLVIDVAFYFGIMVGIIIMPINDYLYSNG